MFESGELPPAVARTMIRPAKASRPSDHWSLGNRILMILAGTEDARGFKAWQEVGRRVKKGARAFHILAPVTRKVTKKADDPGAGEEPEEQEKRVITGFRLIPVFRLEDTEGATLPEVSYDPPEPPPLQDAAKAFGVEEILYAPGKDGSYGFFSWQGRKRIVLHTHDVKTWFHELGHAVHGTIRPLKGGQVPEQEIVAELFAAAMCELHGIRGYHRYTWEYVKSYSG